MSNSQVTPDLRRWIAEQSAVGHTPEALLGSMLASGWSAPAAEQAAMTLMQTASTSSSWSWRSKKNSVSKYLSLTLKVSTLSAKPSRSSRQKSSKPLESRYLCKELVTALP